MTSFSNWENKTKHQNLKKRKGTNLTLKLKKNELKILEEWLLGFLFEGHQELCKIF